MDDAGWHAWRGEAVYVRSNLTTGQPGIHHVIAHGIGRLINRAEGAAMRARHGDRRCLLHRIHRGDRANDLPANLTPAERC